jgi:hypothetical protein
MMGDTRTFTIEELTSNDDDSNHVSIGFVGVISDRMMDARRRRIATEFGERISQTLDILAREIVGGRFGGDEP